MASAAASAAAAANSYIGCFLSLLSRSEMRYAGVLCRIDPQDAVIGLADGSFDTFRPFFGFSFSVSS